MLHIIPSFQLAKASHLVALVKNKFDFETYNFLQLDPPV
jgi:hypothetical protein